MHSLFLEIIKCRFLCGSHLLFSLASWILDTIASHLIFKRCATASAYSELSPYIYNAPAVRMEITYASPSFSDLRAMPSSATAARPVRIIPLQHPTATTSSPQPNAAFSRWTAKLRRMTWLEWIEFFLPCLRWIRIYNWREYFQVDLMAGITVGVMLVPQVIDDDARFLLNEFSNSEVLNC